jgi:hypothetical protein
MLDEMNLLAKTALLGTALTVGTTLVYDEMTPPAATYFQEVQVAPATQPTETSADGFVYSKVESDPLPLKSNSVTVDLVGTGPPIQDNYPRGPQPDSTSTNQTNFGLVRVN